MGKRIAVLVAAWLLFLGIVSTARADGVIIPIPPRPPRPEPVTYLAIRYHRVKVTIVDQVATTEVDQVFVNEQPYELEGTYMFPLPEGAGISDFAMYVDGQKIEGRILDKDEARQIYEETVRRQRDPALLQYVGRNAFQARIYPIPAKGEKRVTLRYSEVLSGEGGLVRYRYPLDTERFSSKPIQDVSIHVDIRSRQPLKGLYSPSHAVAVVRDGDLRAEVGFEERNTRPDRDFELYYSVASGDLSLNLLSYKEKGEDGFFLLLAAPKVQANAQEVLARDVVIVLDTSGSMRGAKLKQAQDALAYILEHLNAEDRFNIVAFSSGVRRYAATLQPVSQTADALSFVRGLQAEGGTNIDRALSEALALLGKGERPQVVLFLTDGLATEGVVETNKIIANVAKNAPQNARLFTFGIGDEVNTILLDTIARNHRGASAYVRPSQSISEVVSAFYAKVGAPLLSDLQIDWGGMLVEELYPYPLPDLFAGGQLLVVGRYRQGGSATVTLKGKVNERAVSYRYPGIQFAASGGESFIPRLWAMRKIGYLLNEIRLRGENRELIDEIVALSVRYGVMTPYTAFLVDENEDVLTTAGRGQAANRMYEQAARATPAAAGAPAVERSVAQKALQDSAVAAAPTMVAAAPGAVERGVQVKYVGDVSFILRNGVWMDTRYDPARMKARQIRFGSEAYFALLAERPDWGRYLAVGARVIVLLDGQAIEIAEQGEVVAPTLSPTRVAAPTPARPTVTPGMRWRRFWDWLNELFR